MSRAHDNSVASKSFYKRARSLAKKCLLFTKALFEGLLIQVKVALLGFIGNFFESQNKVRSKTILVTGIVTYGGGVFTFLTFMLEQLTQSHRVVVSFKESEIKGELISLCERLNLELIPRFGSSQKQEILEVGRIIRRVSPDFTLVNVGSFFYCLHLLALRAPLLYYSHSIWHSPLNREEALFLRFLKTRKHQIVTVSKAARKSLSEAYFLSWRKAPEILFVYNGVVDRTPEHMEREQREAVGPVVVFSLGMVVSYKNPGLWFRVAQKVVSILPTGSIKFVWAGGGDLLDEMKSKNSSQIEFVGHLQNPDKALGECSIYLQTSRFESFGLGVCEAMMFGKPVVATKVGALPELVSDGVEGFLVSDADEELIVERIVRLAQDKDLRAKMGMLARTRYLEAFTDLIWRRSFEDLIANTESFHTRRSAI